MDKDDLVRMNGKKWLDFIRNEPDCPITAGIPNEKDALWQCQQLAAIGIESTEENSLLWNLFADIHGTCASMLAAKGPIVNSEQCRPEDDNGQG